MTNNEHANLVRDYATKIGGWPCTKYGTFEQQLLANEVCRDISVWLHERANEARSGNTEVYETLKIQNTTV